VDPATPAIIATPEGLTINPDSDPAKVGAALMQWIKSARRIALAEAAELPDKTITHDALIDIAREDRKRGGRS
jgi:hypothetical protein